MKRIHDIWHSRGTCSVVSEYGIVMIACPFFKDWVGKEISEFLRWSKRHHFGVFERPEPEMTVKNELEGQTDQKG